MTTTTNKATTTDNNVFLSLSTQKIAAGERAIMTAFDKRGSFVSSRNVNSGMTDSDSRDYTTIKKHLKGSIKNVARVLAVANIKADLIFNRERVTGQRANMKAILKVLQACDLLCGNRDKKGLQKVVRCFIGASILATCKGKEVLTTDDQMNVLSSGTISPNDMSQELIDAIKEAEYKHGSMSKTGGAGTQSSQMRTILDNLNALDYIKVDNTNGIRINLQSPVTVGFANAFGITLPSAS